MSESVFIQQEVSKKFVKLFKLLRSRGEFKNQTDFASRLKFHRQSLHLILKGERDVPLKLLYDFIQEFNLDPNYFFQTKKKVKRKLKYLNSENRVNYIDNLSNDDFKASLNVKPNNCEVHSEAEMSFEIQDDILAPTLQKGDWVYCNKVPVNMSLNVHEMYIFVTNNDIHVQRYVGTNTDKNSLFITNGLGIGKHQLLPIKMVLEIWSIKSLFRYNFSSEFGLSNRIGKIEKAMIGLL